MHFIEALDIKISKQSKELIELTMEVSDIHKQPFGIVHGGIYGVLIETAVSIGGMTQFSDPNKFVVGVDLQVNHLKSTEAGTLITRAIPNRIGKTLQVWQADIFNDKGQTVAVGRCTLANQEK